MDDLPNRTLEISKAYNNIVESLKSFKIYGEVVNIHSFQELVVGSYLLGDALGRIYEIQESISRNEKVLNEIKDACEIFAILKSKDKDSNNANVDD